jgi:spore coat polysaccharide biosynthesis protein SpsF
LKKNEKSKIAAVIACRLNSTRLFAKPLQVVGKSTILDLCINQIKKSKLVDDIVLAISNSPGKEVFIKFAKEKEVKFVLGDEINVLKRLIVGAKKVNAKIIVRASSENPFLYGTGIDSLIKKHVNGDFDLSYLGGMPLGTGVQVINLEVLEKSHRLGNKRHRSEFCTMYISENPTKFRIFRFDPPKQLNRPEIRLTVDTPQDLIVARIIQEKLGKGNSIISLKKIIKFLDKNPNIKKLNSNILVRYKREDL